MCVSEQEGGGGQREREKGGGKRSKHSNSRYPIRVDNMLCQVTKKLMQAENVFRSSQNQ